MTQGRTYTLSTLDHILQLPEIQAVSRELRPLQG